MERRRLRMQSMQSAVRRTFVIRKGANISYRTPKMPISHLRPLHATGSYIRSEMEMKYAAAIVNSARCPTKPVQTTPGLPIGQGNSTDKDPHYKLEGFWIHWQCLHCILHLRRNLTENLRMT